MPLFGANSRPRRRFAATCNLLIVGALLNVSIATILFCTQSCTAWRESTSAPSAPPFSSSFPGHGHSIPYFSCRNPRSLLGKAFASSCQVNILQRICRSTGHTHFITAYRASSSASLLASLSTQKAQLAERAARTFAWPGDKTLQPRAQ
jgi:hypothetical protein